MAIYHLESQIISRGGGRSAVAAAAYRHAARMEFEREGRVADFSNKKHVAFAEFLAPDDAPAWLTAMMEDRTASETSEAFWNKVEAFEKRVDAQLARDFTIALPLELTAEQNIALRTGVIKDGQLYIQAGGGVVYDSDPEAEFMETVNKSRALRRAAEEAARFVRGNG